MGSTHLDGLRAAVLEHGADLGVAYDGDADRCLAVDAEGEVVNGDQIMGLLALAMQRSGALYHDTLVATVMSNLGLHRAMRDAGITIIESAVGDRYVLEAMREGGYTLGGEQSGHVILTDYATTGDGVLTSLVLAAQVAVARLARGARCAASSRSRRCSSTCPTATAPASTPIARSARPLPRRAQNWVTSGRVLLRPSGTEPLVRVMVEATPPTRRSGMRTSARGGRARAARAVMSLWDWVLHFSSNVEEAVLDAAESVWIYFWIFAMLARSTASSPWCRARRSSSPGLDGCRRHRARPCLPLIWLCAAAGRVVR